MILEYLIFLLSSDFFLRFRTACPQTTIAAVPTADAIATCHISHNQIISPTIISF